MCSSRQSGWLIYGPPNHRGTDMTSGVLWRYRSYAPERQTDLEEISSEGRVWYPAAMRFSDPFNLNARSFFPCTKNSQTSPKKI